MDDLVKQALADRIKEHDAAFTNLHREYDRRGDRIEELIEEGSVMAQKLDAAEAKLAECEAKLEKAVEGLDWVGRRSMILEADASNLRLHARMVIAELKGQNDE